jgi:hypothetical protein
MRMMPEDSRLIVAMAEPIWKRPTTVSAEMQSAIAQTVADTKIFLAVFIPGFYQIKTACGVNYAQKKT